MSYLKIPTGMSKSQSLDLLKNNGFNVIDYQVCNEICEVKSFIQSRQMDRMGYSIRTEKVGQDNKSSFKFPFYMGMKQEEKVIEVAELLLSQGYTLIVSQTLDPDDTICKGTAVINYDEDHVMLEYIIGPGTVRQLEEQTPIISHLGIFSNPKPSWMRAIFNFMLDHLLTPDIIVEWSYYPYPVGILKQHLILWELRPWQ